MHGTKPYRRPPTVHLVHLAGSPEGYRALGRFLTRGQMRGVKDAPVFDWDDLAEVAATREVWALSGCHNGAVPAAAARGDLDGAMSAATYLRDLFGPRFHLEMWHHGMPGDDRRNDLMWEVAQRLGIGVVATNQPHYAGRSDADLPEVLAAIAGRRSLEEADGFRPATDLRHLRPPGEMEQLFRRYPGAVARAGELGERLAFDLG